ncbi:MAG: hypothetical protein MZU79_06765 [Anaerotruncus sp.]|nr:hypothetical protein [Anaerotruncus sp.]
MVKEAADGTQTNLCFSEIEDYRLLLENKHLRTKNKFVLILVLLLGAAVITYMFLTRSDWKTTLSLMAGFLIVILVNVAHAGVWSGQTIDSIK